MNLVWKRGEPFIAVTFDDGKVFCYPVSNDVRNAANGRRSLENPEDVVYTTPGNNTPSYPYQPSGFPSGRWKITGVHSRTSDYLAPYFLATDAWHWTKKWTTTPVGDYMAETDVNVRDAEFGLHYAKGTSTTLGCLRFLNKAELVLVAKAVIKAFRAGDTVWLEVQD